jgi:hypothetical protein
LFLSSVDKSGFSNFFSKAKTASSYFFSNQVIKLSANLSRSNRFCHIVSTLLLIQAFHLIKAFPRFTHAIAKKYSLEKKSYFKVGFDFKALNSQFLSLKFTQIISDIFFIISHSFLEFFFIKSNTSFQDINQLSDSFTSQFQSKSQRDSKTFASKFFSIVCIELIIFNKSYHLFFQFDNLSTFSFSSGFDS